MARHPIHQANANNPFGDLTVEEFYKKHQILHHQNFMLNDRNMKIFSQSWQPCNTSNGNRLKGLVAMVHGYAVDSSWLFQLTAVAIAKAGFYVCALDLQGHGYSEGFPGHIPNIKPVVRDCIQFFDSARAKYPFLPAFLYGESLGGAIAILIALKQNTEWNGLVLSGAMCGISKEMKPIWPLEKLLPVAACLGPNWRPPMTKRPASGSYKEEWKRQLVAKNPIRRVRGKPPTGTALEFLRVCDYIKKHIKKLEVPLLMVHGGNDRICNPRSARVVYELAASHNKSLMIFDDMWHLFIGEPNDKVDLVFATILSWIEKRASYQLN